DSVKQQVFAVSMLVNSARGMLRGGDVSHAQHCLDETDELAQRVQAELTALVRALRPVGLEEKGLAAALRELAAQWARQSGIAARVEIEGAAPSAPRIEETLFRVAQEALANVARHSRATMVHIRLIYADESWTLAVEDNGRGFAPSAPAPAQGG